MWDPAEFAEHWRREFPGSEVPRMQLNSVAELEAELERSRERLRLGQNLLAREKFKVIYLETALGREPPGTTTRPESPSQRRRHEGIGAPGGSQQTYSSGKHWSSPGPEGDFLGSHSNGADQGAENAGQNQDHQWRDGDSEEDVETEPSPSPARPLLFPRFRGLPMKRGKDASPMLQRQQFLTVSPTIHGDSCPSEGSDREQGSDRDSTGPACAVYTNRPGLRCVHRLAQPAPCTPTSSEYAVYTDRPGQRSVHQPIQTTHCTPSSPADAVHIDHPGLQSVNQQARPTLSTPTGPACAEYPDRPGLR
ncbi:uncharacterized protein [Narcine bancroftii]|uniref:uncharacterized protein n=1 Tax=Narcine bancroftii TaxID=1343680 RepID=UPI003831A66A